MIFQWSYFVMVLCFSLTSSAVLNFHGNGLSRHGDEPSDVKRDEIQTPPIGGLLHDWIHRDFRNDSICRELCARGDGGNACLCDWSPLKKQSLFSIKKLYKERPFQLFKFPTPEDEPACKFLCQFGEDGHLCLCH